MSRAKAPGSDREPAVAYDPTANNYLVVFSRSMGVNYPCANVYGQRFAATGTRMGANFQSIAAPQWRVRTVGRPSYSDAAKSYFLVWSDTRNAEHPRTRRLRAATLRAR